jgi:biopolymer transport protein ExbD
MLIRRHDEQDVDVQLSTFMDMAFLLLCFFLVTASLRKPHKELQLDLPSAAYAKIAKAPKEELVISIDREGKIYLGKEAIFSDQELTKRLQQLAMSAPQTRVRIDADRQARVFHLAKVVDLCQLYNIRNLGIRTRTD